MKNAIIAIIILICMFLSVGFLSFRIGVENCQRTVAEETIKVQQVVQENDRIITEKVLGAGHISNLQWLCDHWKRAD